MIKKIFITMCFLMLVSVLFLPLVYAINEVNASTDIQYAEFSVDQE